MIVSLQRATALLSGIVLTMTGLAGLASTASAQVGGGNGVIAYDQFRSGDPGSQIWTVDPATGVETDVSGASFGDDQPSVSPDGSRIAFRSNNSIFTMTIAGTGRKNLTPDGQGSSGEPAWSPDGSQLVYTNNGQIVVMDSNGRHRHVIAANSGHREPTWSPDGTTIAYTSTADGEQIYAVDPDGSNVRSLSKDPSVADEQPEWAPDSKHLLFTSNRFPGFFEIFQMAADGSDVNQIAAIYPSGSYDPAYSPDGQSLAFTSNDEGAIQIFVQPIAGGAGSAVRVTNEPSNSGDENLSWQPKVSPRVTAKPHSARPGSTVTVKLSGFGFGETVSLSLKDASGVTTTLGSRVVSGLGKGSAQVTIPASAAEGRAVLSATGQTTARRATTKITVT